MMKTFSTTLPPIINLMRILGARFDEATDHLAAKAEFSNAAALMVVPYHDLHDNAKV